MEQEIAQLRQEFEQFKTQMGQQTHNGIDGDLISLKNIVNLIDTISETAGTTQLDKRKISSPKSISEQMFIYYNYNGGAPYWRLYIFSDDGTGANRVWKYTTIA